MNNLFLLLLLTIVFQFGCKNNNSQQKASQKEIFESAMPHSESLPTQELTQSDKQKLSEAKGKSAIPISKNQLDSMLMFSEDMLYVYSFFRADSQTCKITNDALIDFQKEVGDTSFHLVFFSLDGADRQTELNSAIREKGVTTDVFFPSEKINTEWFSKINPNWSGEVPAIYLLNQTDGIKLFYQKNFTPEELSALIQPFIL